MLPLKSSPTPNPMNARSAQQVYDFFHTEGGKGKAPEVTEEK